MENIVSVQKTKTINGKKYFFEFTLSQAKNKKYSVKIKDSEGNVKKLNFGELPYEHFFDKIGLLDKELNHFDLERKKRFYERHSEVQLSDIKSINDFTANFFAEIYLW